MFIFEHADIQKWCRVFMPIMNFPIAPVAFDESLLNINVTSLFPSYLSPFTLELYERLTKLSILIFKGWRAIFAYEQIRKK